MPNCSLIDPLVTPYVDGELPAAERDLVAAHVRVCAPCHSRVAAEQAVRTLIQARKPTLSVIHAPESLRMKCADAAKLDSLRQPGGSCVSPVSPLSPLGKVSDVVRQMPAP